MKKFITRSMLGVFATASMFFACDSLEEVPESFIAPENFYKTVPQGETALTTAMGSLWNEWYDSSYGFGYRNFINDDQYWGGNLIIGADWGKKWWFAHYTALLNINSVLRSINNGNMQGSQEELDKLAAQARFLRAFNYFSLVQLWGDIPMYTDEDADPSVNPIPRTPSTEVYDQIISDLQFASDKLPSSWSTDKQGRPDKYTAKAYLAKVYLTRASAPLNQTEYYVNARNEAKSIMDATDKVWKLLPDVWDVFKQENKYQQEIMFSLNSNIQDRTTSAQIWAPWEIGGWWNHSGNPVLEQMWPEQPRKEAYLLTEIERNGSMVHYTQWGRKTPANRKFIFPYITQAEWDSYATYTNFPLFRYPEVLLIFAEAENMVNGGPTQAAVDAVNQVIGRANNWEINPEYPLLTIAMSQDDFDRAVIQERNFEFCFEYPNRYYDLLRKRMLLEVNPDFAVNFTEDDYLFPIPSEDLIQNPLLTQNPGYPTP